MCNSMNSIFINESFISGFAESYQYNDGNLLYINVKWNRSVCWRMEWKIKSNSLETETELN
jgi:hypothetical protein